MSIEWLALVRRRPGKALYELFLKFGVSVAIVYSYRFDCTVDRSGLTVPDSISLSVTSAGSFSGSLDHTAMDPDLDPTDTLVLARENERIVGSVVLSTTRSVDVSVLESSVAHDPDVAYLWALYVDPNTRQRGIGRALVQRSLREATQNGLSTVLVLVAIDNHPSRELFRALEPASSELVVYGRVRSIARKLRVPQL